MFELKLTMDVVGWKRDLTVTEFAQLPFATALGLTRIAQAVKKRQEQEIGRIFDRPTRFTRQAIRMWPASKEQLRAVVWLRDDMEGGLKHSNYLTPHIDGGGRKLKRFERMLARIGVLPSGWRAVPGEAARFDSYGNMSSGQIVQILSYVEAFSEQGYQANKTADQRARMRKGRQGRSYGKAFLIVKPRGSARTRHLTPGIYEQTFTGFGTAIRPVLIFVSRIRYRTRWNFEDIGDDVIMDQFSKAMDAALAQAVRTAR